MSRSIPPRRSVQVALAAVAGAAIASLVPARASAIPAFARRTGMPCVSCHESVPMLNDFGEQYRDNGYQLPGRTDSIVRSPDSFPVSVRTNLLYQYVVATQTPTDAGPVTTGSGAIVPPSADLIMGGSIADNLSALVLATGFSADGKVSLESAWTRVSNIFGTPWLNLRAGMMELDLPVSDHRALTLTNEHQFYHYHPGGSANGFSIGDNQLGVELMGHAQGVGLRYSIAAFNGNGVSNGLWSAPVVYAHVTETWHPFAVGLTRIRVGAFATAGAWPTQSGVLTPPQTAVVTPPGITCPPAMPPTAANPSLCAPAAPVAGTANTMVGYQSAGAEVAFTLGPLARPLTVHVVGSVGRESAALTGGAQDPTWMGGFAEVTFTPVLRFTVFGRYDFVRGLQNTDPTQSATLGDIDGGTLGARWWFVQSYMAAMALHLEGSLLQTSAGPGLASQQQSILAVGFDVAL